MDLSTLDATQPDNTDLASAGALEIRRTRDAILTSFAIEHSLTGEHAFKVGNTASRPTAGHSGRIYINTEKDTIQRDNGSAWVDVHTVVTPFGSTRSYDETINEVGGGAVIGTTELVLSEVDITPAVGGLLEVFFSIGGFAIDRSSPLGSTSGNLIIRLRLDGTASTPDGAIATTQTVRFWGQAGNNIEFPWERTLFRTSTFDSLVLHRWKLTAQADVNNSWYWTHMYGKALEHA